MEILKLTNTNEEEIIRAAIQTLSEGQILIFPTETSYGLGVDATNATAVEKIMKYKRKREGKAISIVVSDLEMAKQWVKVNDIALNIYKNLLPGPVTVISEGLHKTAPMIEAENGTQGVRIPKYDLILKISKKFGKPFTATSANISGGKTPYSIDDILNNIHDKQKNLIGLIIDAGELPHNPPSTIVDTVLNGYQILRQGAITFKNEKTFNSSSNTDTIKFAQGMIEDLKKDLENKVIVIGLQGELGAGKTQFTKGVALALGIKENIVSPTFTISREYPYKNGFLIHIDAYKLETEGEIKDIGLESFLVPGNIIVIEWVDKVIELLRQTINTSQVPNRQILMKIDHTDVSSRKITYEII